MKQMRKDRIGSFLRAELAQILQREIKDPRIGFVSVISVKVTDDLKEAEVRVSIMGTETEKRTSMRGLNAARGYIQSLIAKRVSFRQTPVLRFVLDSSIEKGMEMERLLDQIRQEQAGGAPDSEEASTEDVDLNDEIEEAGEVEQGDEIEDDEE